MRIKRKVSLAMKRIVAPGILIIGAAALAQGQVPKGWQARGVTPQAYEIRIDLAVYHAGTTSGSIKSKTSAPKTGILMQSIKADNYLGKRVRLSGYVKGKGVDTYAGLWLRVDGDGEVLGYDNMQNRPIRGTTGWKKYEIVLDVPESSVNIAFGTILVGTGQIWMDDLQLDVVGQDVRTTNIEKLVKEARKQREEYRRTHSRAEEERDLEEWRKTLEDTLAEPVNLDFEG
jgi:hypothetical protein